MASGFQKCVLVPALKEERLTVREATAVIAPSLAQSRMRCFVTSMLSCRLEPSP